MGQPHKYTVHMQARRRLLLCLAGLLDDLIGIATLGYVDPRIRWNTTLAMARYDSRKFGNFR